MAERIMEICKQYPRLHVFYILSGKQRRILDVLDTSSYGRIKKLPEEEKTFKETGTSVHSVEEAEEAVNLGATYLMYGAYLCDKL